MGVMPTLLKHSVAAELGTDGDGVQAFTQTNEAPDLEMKKLLWVLISKLIRHHRNLSYIVEAKFLASLLVYVDPEIHADHPALAKWSPNQVKDLRNLAMATLFTIVPFLPFSFRELKGCSKMLRFAMCFQPDPVTGARASDTDNELAERALTVVARLCTARENDSECFDDLGNVEYIGDLLDVSQSPESKVSFRVNALTIISKVCLGNKETQDHFRKADGISAMIEFLRHETSEISNDTEFLLSVICCVWDCIIGHRKNEAYFIVADGVDILLDLLLETP
eukprot:766906_1